MSNSLEYKNAFWCSVTYCWWRITWIIMWYLLWTFAFRCRRIYCMTIEIDITTRLPVLVWISTIPWRQYDREKSHLSYRHVVCKINVCSLKTDVGFFLASGLQYHTAVGFIMTLSVFRFGHFRPLEGTGNVQIYSLLFLRDAYGGIITARGVGTCIGYGRFLV